jgi:chemotaxis protein CheC
MHMQMEFQSPHSSGSGALPFDCLLLDPLQLDAVREAANVGACNAAGALSDLTGLRVGVEPPRVAVKPVAELVKNLAKPGTRAAAVVDTVLGDLTGQVVFIMPQDEAVREAGFTRAESLEPGAFRQAADLVISSYLERLGGMLGLVLAVEPGRPDIHQAEELEAGLSAALDSGSRFAFCIDSRFILSASGRRLPGHFLFLPGMESLPVILGALFRERTAPVSPPCTSTGSV